MGKRALIILFAGCALLLAGCGKQDIFGGKYSRLPGDPVVFGITSEQLTGTRTEYRAGDYGTGDIQPIDWLSGDKIRVYSPDATRAAWNQPKHWADYTVTPTATDKSKGTLSHVGANGLSWQDGGNHTFYGFFPAPAGTEEDNPEGAQGIFRFTLPAEQAPEAEMDYAYMTAVASVQAGGVSGDAVRLDFRPGFTTFEFTLTASEPVTLHSFVLSSTASSVTGDCVLTYAESGAVTCTGPGTNTPATVSFGDSGKTLAADETVTITVFALPVDLTNMKITLVASTPGSANPQRSNSLELKYADTATQHTPGSYIVFDARKFHRIKGIVNPKSTKIIQVNSQIVDWSDQGTTAIDVIP